MCRIKIERTGFLKTKKSFLNNYLRAYFCKKMENLMTIRGKFEKYGIDHNDIFTHHSYSKFYADSNAKKRI